MEAQEGNIIPAFGKQGNLQTDHIDPIIEIRSKKALGNLLFQVFVACGKNSSW
jgi:hypothetical protein